MNTKEDIIERIREFNRFYTVLIGTLNKHFLDSEYSVTETRILFELDSHDGCQAKNIIDELHIDKSYMSRIMKRFEKQGLITKERVNEDHRAYTIQLTHQGHHEVKTLITKTNQQIHELLIALDMNECQEICDAMDLITKHLSKGKDDR